MYKDKTIAREQISLTSLVSWQLRKRQRSMKELKPSHWIKQTS